MINMNPIIAGIIAAFIVSILLQTLNKFEKYEQEILTFCGAFILIAFTIWMWNTFTAFPH